MKRTLSTTRPVTRRVASLLLASFVLAACGGDDDSTATTLAPQPRVTVSSVKGDAASELLGAIYARLLEDAGFRVSRRDPVDMPREQYIAELEAGSIDVLTDWTGDLVVYLYADRDTPPSTSVPDSPATTAAPITIPTTTTVPETVPDTATDDTGTDDTATDHTTADTTADTTAEETTTTLPPDTTIAGPEGLPTTTTLPEPITNGRSTTEQVVAIQAALPVNVVNANAIAGERKDIIACTADAMEANAGFQLVTLTDLASIAPQIRLGATAEWQADTEDGLPAWELFYGGEFAEVVTVTDPAAAAEAGDVDCVVINSLDPAVGTQRMTVLTDDKVMFVGNAAIALVNAELGTPDLLATLDAAASALTTSELNRLVRLVENGGDVVEIANAFVDAL